MAAVANIVINDGQATPVAHTFEPTRVSPNLVSYHDKVSGVFAGYPSISLGNRVPNKQNANYKASAVSGCLFWKRRLQRPQVLHLVLLSPMPYLAMSIA